MRMITLKGETSVRELSERLFGNLDAEARGRAEKALLKANPQLGAKSGFRPGVVVNVPSVRGVKARAGAAGDDPVAELREVLADAVSAHRDRLGKALDARAADLDAQNEVLKTRDIAAAIKNAPGGPELAKQLSETLRNRGKEIAEDRKRQAAAFDRMAADLKALKLG